MKKTKKPRRPSPTERLHHAEAVISVQARKIDELLNRLHGISGGPTQSAQDEYHLGAGHPANCRCILSRRGAGAVDAAAEALGLPVDRWV